MRVASPLLFALAILVNYIACGNLCNKKNNPLNGVKVIRLTKKELFGAYYKPDERRKDIYPVQEYLDVVVKGDMIIGRQYQREFRPIVDEHGNLVEKGIDATTWTKIKPEDIVAKGFFSELPKDTYYDQPCYPWTSPSTSSSTRSSRH